MKIYFYKGANTHYPNRWIASTAPDTNNLYMYQLLFVGTFCDGIVERLKSDGFQARKTKYDSYIGQVSVTFKNKSDEAFFMIRFRRN